MFVAVEAESDVEDEAEDDGARDQILQIHYKVTCCVLAMGVPLERWKKCISCHIEKDSGSLKLHQLRIFHIYEADINLVLNLLWSQRLIQQAEQHFLLGEDQCGL